MTQGPNTTHALTGTEEEWDRCGELGDRATRSALATAAISLGRNAPAAAPLAVGLGAVKAIGEYLRHISRPEGAHVLEQNAMAYLRGALRGADGPILDSGQPFTGASDA